MVEKPIATWKRVLGYLAFGLAALVVSFFLTFPYDTLKERVRLEAENAGYFVKLGSLGPGFFSLRATNVQVSKKAVPLPGLGDAANGAGFDPGEALTIDSISVGPSFFPPGVAVSSKLLGGSASVRLSGLSAINVKVAADDLNLSKGNLKGFTGVDFSGEVDLAVNLSVPRAAVGSGPSEPDLGAANGTLTLNTRGLTVNGGTFTATIAMFGPEPTPLDLPKIQVGELGGNIKIEKGLLTVEEFKGKSADLEINAGGTIKLAKRVEYSEPNLEIRYKPDPEFQKRLGLIGSALSMVGPDPKDPTWRMGRLTGMLGRPNFR